MEASTRRLTSEVLIAGCLAASVALSSLAGCSSARKKARPDGQSGAPQGTFNLPPNAAPPTGPTESYGPPVPSTADNPTTTYGPEPVSLRPVVLVLGPGMARGYSYVGVIRALSENKIPIGAILGTEMGALIGSLYAMDAKINQFEWALLKFREQTFTRSESLLPSLFQKSNNAKKFEQALARVFDHRDLNQSQIPVRVEVVTGETNSPVLLERGPITTALRAAMADPELFEPGTWNGVTAKSAAQVRPFLISEARAMNLGPVVVIDALDDKDERQNAGAAEMKDADLVIRPELAGIGSTDFQKRTDAAFRGKKAVNAHLAEIRHLVGLPAEAEPEKGTNP